MTSLLKDRSAGIAGTEKAEAARRAAKALSARLRQEMTRIDATPSMPDRTQKWNQLQSARDGLTIAIGQTAGNLDSAKAETRYANPKALKRTRMSQAEYDQLITQVKIFQATARSAARAQGNQALTLLSQDADVLLQTLLENKDRIVA